MAPTSNDPSTQDALRALPSVDALLGQPAVGRLLDDHPRTEVVLAVRAVLDDIRAKLRRGEAADYDVPSLALGIRQYLYERAQPRLRRVINATGIVLHTNLGRAPLAEEAVEAITDAAYSYCNLEYNLDAGQRGNRHDHLRELLRELSGAEDAMVVNNNAAATFLALHALAAGRDVIVSRGQLVEIGGSYRLPDIMAAAQCRLVEVGTTNRTRIADYERAVTDNTSVLLRVHWSNYRIVGFTQSASLAELVELGHKHGLHVVDDLGSGLLTHDLPWPNADYPITDWDEPSVRDSMRTGADLALFSGDKLLGGPQAGVIVGRAELIARLRANPLARTLRPGKLTLAGLEATLRLYRDPAMAVARIPVLRLLARTRAELEDAARRLADAIGAQLPEAEITVEEDASEAGGGTLAACAFPTCVVRVRAGESPAAITAQLRRGALPIIARIRDDAIVFDPRTLSADDMEQIPPALAEAVREVGAPGNPPHNSVRGGGGC